MSQLAFLLGLLIISFLVHSLFFVPYINLLYRIKFQRLEQRTKDAFGKLTPIFDRFHKKKAGVPVGGGLLIILVTLALYGISFLTLYYLREWYPITSLYPQLIEEIKIILFTFIAFAIVGFYDDFRKTFLPKNQDFFGLRVRHKLILQLVISAISAYWLYTLLDISFIYVPLVEWELPIGVWYVPFAAFVILAFANAFNISDGLDGLSSGVLVIALIAFWVISAGLLDTPLSVFIPLLLGGLIAFLYFNVYPARIILGDVGALSFGATFAVIGLMLGKPFTLVIIGGIYVVEAATSLLQLLWKRFYHKKLMPVAPLHLYLQYLGWEEPKIVMRLWLVGMMLAVFGLWLSLLR
ncbi:MAG: phospho-N-acetylmuramoyl-pentapeptide-transferase [Candidatus Roizmanbacteria bacterium]|nr:phospho-N-acetylmuramoyl-pentapeptide-transferase [Candidatus Roizmanbacteria bacterium]